MRRRGLAALAVLAGLGLAGAVEAATFTVQGRFLYEDRIWNKNGYTGTVQNLPIRHADVQVVKSSGGAIIGTGSTDADGNFSVVVTGQVGTVGLYVRCRTSTDNSTNYFIRVIDINSSCSFGSTVWSITTSTYNQDTSIPLLDVGDWLIQDTTGSGVAQAFNILDQAVDAFDYLATPQGIGRYPVASEYVRYGWNGTSGCNGSFYSGHYIAVTSTASDTDGWSDMVILHETGHWASDMFGRDDNTGGTHYIGDYNQDPRLSYGEGYATFFAAQVREWRAPRLNLVGQPVDDHVSIYADLTIPPALPSSGGLGFAYDFETGLFNTGVPIGQIGSACETNVTSAMWDIVDGAGTPDESPGVDDDPLDDDGSLCWDVIQNYMTTLNPPNWITVEDFYTGWFVRHGSGFMQAGMESVFVGLAQMPFEPDGFEPDDTPAQAPPVSIQSYAAGPGGKVVVNEIDQGAVDRLELQNTKDVAVTLTNWSVGFSWTSPTYQYTYVFPSFVLPPGGTVVLVETAGTNTANTLYLNNNLSWANGSQGAVVLKNDMGNAVDFVRWGGSTVPVPAGVSFTGSLASAPGGKAMGRDPSGTDTDAASDFSIQDLTMGYPNFQGTPARTLYPAGDADLLKLTLTGGTVVVVRGESPHSAGEPRVEILDGSGTSLGSNQAFDGNSRQAQLQFLVPADGTYYARATHVGVLTDFAPLNLLAYERPVASVLSPPIALVADPANASDTGDAVHLTWLNGGAYDSLRVYRDGGVVATLAGSALWADDAADRGSHAYQVGGFVGGVESPRATAQVFTGVLDCTFADSLETGTAAFQLQAPWGRTSTLAADGTWSLTDSPAGNYADGIDVSASIIVPVELKAWPTLEFDQICITEATYDFGIVEISSDFGTTWTELARYDMDDYPQWNDGSADPGDWVHTVVDLNPWVGKKVRIRFRLLTDGYVNFDGWYLDNIMISNPSCRTVTGIPDHPAGPVPILALSGPNPFRGRLTLSLAAKVGEPARLQVFDAAGRLVRTLFDGLAPAARIESTWDGKDGTGRGTAAGLYFLRGVSGKAVAVKRVVKLP